MKKQQVDWVQLVKNAKKSSRGLEDLYVALGSAFGLLLHLCDTKYHDDALQEARLKVWQALNRVDLSRPTEIKAYLGGMVLWGMKDWFRIMGRQRFFQVSKPETDDDESLDYNISEISAKTTKTYQFDYDNILSSYLDFIKETGGFYGAHKYVSKKLGIKKHIVVLLFRNSANALINKYRLAGMPN